MEEIFVIPLTNVPQRFTIELSGIAYIIVCKWNGEMPAWTIDISDEVTGQPLIVNLPLVAGVNLLEQFKHVGIPGKLFVYTDGDEFAPPTLDNLGQEANLYYLVDA
jgi:hypothetical protein